MNTLWWHSPFLEKDLALWYYPGGPGGFFDLAVGPIRLRSEIYAYNFLASSVYRRWSSGFGVGVAAGLPLTPRLQLTGALTCGGGWDNLFRAPFAEDLLEDQRAMWYARAVLGLDAYLSRAISVDSGFSLACMNALWQPAVSLGLAYHARPRWDSLVWVASVRCGEVVPVLALSGARPAAVEVQLANHSPYGAAVRQIEVEVFAPGYMQQPVRVALEGELRAGQRRSVQVQLLLGAEVLGLREGRDVAVEVKARYRYAFWRRQSQASGLMHVYGSNAVSWEDDRVAAAFVTAKDPQLLGLGGRVAALLGQEGLVSFSGEYLRALGLFEALGCLGLGYVPDPQTPFRRVGVRGGGLDYVRFPLQTLQQGAGDCDDLTVLYCALLEAVGVPSALVTVPGHLLAAFRLGMGLEEASRLLSGVEELVVREDGVWVPVEVTQLAGGFEQARRAGAQQWRDHGGQAGLHPVREAWGSYPPLEYGGGGAAGRLEAEPLLQRVRAELERLREAEMQPLVRQLEQQAAQSGMPWRELNRLGVLYVRHGCYEQARESFQRALQGRAYLPALLNLALLHRLQGSYQEALLLLQQAASLKPANPSIESALTEVLREAGLQAPAEPLPGEETPPSASPDGRGATPAGDLPWLWSE